MKAREDASEELSVWRYGVVWREKEEKRLGKAK